MIHWNEGDLDYLKSHAHLGVAAVANHLGRSETATKNKAHYLGVSFGKGNAPKWSRFDETLLVAFAGFGVKAISRITKRPIPSINNRASTLGVSLQTRYGKEDHMTEVLEEAAAVIEHDGGWPRQSAEAMALAGAYVASPADHAKKVSAWEDRNPELMNCIIVGDRLATQVNLAFYAFGGIGDLRKVERLDPELYQRFLMQKELWDNAESEEDREEHAGGMVRAYQVLADRLVQNDE